MRRLLLPLVLLLLTAPTVQAGELTARDGWRVQSTSYSFPELWERLKTTVKANKMGLVTTASASAGAAGQGIAIPGNRVAGVYRNDFARRMLDANLAAGIEAPIRFYLTENADGTATLSYKTPSLVFAPYMKEGGVKLETLASELDHVFENIFEQTIAQ
ncbi:MAG: hypothetical protein Kilf2KO_22980 [Rhodospirillales bacterium]